MKTGLLKNVKRGVAAIESKYLVACIAVAAPALSWAQATGTGTVSGFETARGVAGTRKLDDVAANAERTSNAGYNAMIVFFTVLGVLLVGLSLWGMYKSSKDERETPKSAIVGLIIGGGLTVIGIITAFSANTLVT